MAKEGPLTADEAFKLLGEETRLEILRTVWAADGPVTFTEIRKEMGGPDSGKFNYHIDKLRGPFLVSGEEGYRLTQAGREVVRAVLAGTVDHRPATDAMPIGARCVECDGDLVALYDGYGIVECRDCGATVMWNEFPPAGLEGRTGEEFAAAFDRWTQARFRLAMDGICPSCAAGMTAEVLDDDPENLASRHRCPNCKYEARIPLFGHVLGHPAVIAFYYDGGIDVGRLPYWDLQRLAEDIDEAVIAEDPWRGRVTIQTGGRAIALTLGGRLDVVDVERSG